MADLVLPELPDTRVRTPRRGRRRASSRRFWQLRGARPAGAATRDAVRGGSRARRSAHRRAHGLRGTVGLTLAGALLPGSGLIWTGRRLIGLLVLVPAVIALAGGTWYVGRDLQHVIDFAFDPTRLRIAAAIIAGGLLIWAAMVYLTYRSVRPADRPRWHSIVGHAFVLLLVLAVGAPFAVAARYATVQADFVKTVFASNETATVPQDVTEKDPWGGRDRVNVLLLGGDGGVGRTGVRTDSVILVSIDTASGKTTMFSLPRNMMYAQFPEDSPLHDLYPDGYTGEGDAGFYMLNAIYGQIPARHPGILGASKNEGADAIKQAVSGSLGVPVDYYVLVNLKGFQEIVDAIGGITVNVNEPVAINGNTDAGIPPTGYIQPGPDQHLDGFHALWFARGRYGSDDYERMDRQRCTVDAIIEAADPFTLLTRYQQLVAAGKEIIFSDIPLKLVPAFVDLALEVKDAKVRSVVFKTSERFFSGDPDYAWVQETVAKALTPRPRSGPKDDPGRPKNAKSSCAYDPVTPTS